MSFRLLFCQLFARRPSHPPLQTKDRVALSLPGLNLNVERAGRLSVPSELTVVIPRAELRASLTSPSGEQASVEVILNSITVAHSPRPQPEQPPRPPRRGQTPIPPVSRGSAPAGT